MPTITLADIKQEHSKVTEMIAKFERQSQVRTIEIGAQTIALAHGEEYAGILLGKDGQPDSHLILLPGDADSVAWKSALDWAAEIGGELPTRREQALLYANLSEQFKSEWYWSCEAHASASDYAWGQGFYHGSQDSSTKTHELRARAVRRLAIL